MKNEWRNAEDIEDKNQNNNIEIINQNEQINLKTDTRKRKVGGRQKKSEEERTRKRVRNDRSWRENVRRELKEKGKEYVSKKGVMKQGKEIKNPAIAE